MSISSLSFYFFSAIKRNKLDNDELGFVGTVLWDSIGNGFSVVVYCSSLYPKNWWKPLHRFVNLMC